MSIRQLPLSLLAAVALLAGACSSSDGEVTATAGATPGDETAGTVEVDESSDPPDDSENRASDSTGANDSDSGEEPPADDGEPGDDEDAPDPDSDEPDPIDDPEAALTEFIGGEVPAEVEKCVVGGILDDPDLRAAALDLSPYAEMTDLELAQQLVLLELSVECAGPELFGQFMAEGFADGSGMAAPEGMGECFADEFGGPDGSLVMAGLVAVGNDLPAGSKVRAPLVDALTECVSASFVADAIVAELLVDPTFEDAADIECIRTAYDETSIEPLWAAWVEAPTDDFAELSPEVTAAVFTPLFDCISFGAVMAAEAAEDGVELSAESIACIDEELSGSGLFATILAGEEPDAEVLGLAILGCLTPEELVQMAG